MAVSENVSEPGKEEAQEGQECGGREKHTNTLNLLDGDNLSWIDLDDKTLQCLVGGMPLPQVGQMDEAGPSDPSKQVHWIPDMGKQEGEKRKSADSDEVNGKSKKSRSAAAVAKADREKKRREKLNSCFEELAQVCGGEGTGYKTDRLSIIVDAIRVVRQLRVEVNQLRQLNKFLEERTGTLERERAQVMYQQYPGVQHHMVQQVPQPQVASHSFVDHNSNGLGKHDQQYGMMAPQQQQQQQQPHGDVVQGKPWLPASNLSEDEKLRPPAA
ncbi:hypothetical protein M9435_004642 [Picochlorum sp. BPE23]|nr:hypothetical protein M9435_004642 [Picochlorum sp. BPE23]